MTNSVTVSVVSHGHGPMVVGLVNQLLASHHVAKVVLTKNIQETLDVKAHPKVLIVENTQPKGFGANHNAAFRSCQTPYFAVVNPDISVEGGTFGALERCMREQNAALVVPLVYNPDGDLEDSVRNFPTIRSIFRKSLRIDDGRLDLGQSVCTVPVPWAAGMFMLFAASEFAMIGGFDESYFLYYEDVDLCVRLRRIGKEIILCADARVVHDARRASRRNLRHAYWHGSSMARFLITQSWRLP
jgi:N-acetylglucosaminyl-diphospho-decaprenol L-rhamnosyltransferase